MAQPTLDDVALYVLRLEPDDRAQLGRAREQLAALAFANRVGIAAQSYVAGAIRALKPLADGTAVDPAAAMREVGRLLQCALGPARGAPAAPASYAVETAPHSGGAGAGEVSAEDVLAEDVDPELLTDFVVESRDCLAAAEAALLALEQRPGDTDALDSVFRAFHTIKGTSAFLGLGRTSAFAHAAESLLTRVRAGAVAYGPGCAELALRAVDALRASLDAVDAGAREGVRGAPVAAPESLEALVRALLTYDPAAADSAAAPAARPDGLEPDRRRSERRQVDRREIEAEADQFLRVRTDRLDLLVDMVSELAIAQSMVASDEALSALSVGSHDVAKKLGHTGKLVRGLQELSIGMRMVPLHGTFQKVARLVRDVSAKVGKPVDLVTDGGGTEIDRKLVDLVGDPLVHMVRNALDHGIETPAERAAAGKAARGSLRLSAYHAGGSVVVELADDGRGFDRARIARKALERGLIATEHGLGEADVFRLIFAAGFSTVDAVTEWSGRGVGMDVVRRNVERARGRVDVASRAGEGSTITLRLPLTLAVTDGMLVRVGAERYVVPTASIHTSFSPEPGAVGTIAGRGEVVTCRGEVMPVVRLHRLFDIPDAEADPARGLYVVVGDGRRRRAALLVDELLGQQQVVAKSLGSGVGRVEGVAGGAILGDGRVGLILDAAEVVALAERGAACGAARAGAAARAA